MRRRTFFIFTAAVAAVTLALNVSGGTRGPDVVLAARVPSRMAAPLADAVAAPAPDPAAAAPAAPAADLPIAPPPASFAGASPVAVAPPRPLAAPVTSALQSGTWSVVIGINDYPGTENDLHYADNDANDMVKALNLQGVEGSHILSLRDGQVTPSVVHSAVDWLNAHAGPDAIATFFYAGHVMKVAGTSSEAMVTSDGGHVWDVDLAKWLKPLQARRAWFAFAACYSGGFNEILAPGRVLTAAAGPNDVAYESSRFSRSYLGEFMIHRAMIEGLANNTIETAFKYARDAIAREYPNRVPVQYDYGDGNLNLRPNGAPGTTPPPPSSPPSPTNAPAKAPPPSDAKKKCAGLALLCK